MACIVTELTEIYIHSDRNQYIYVNRTWSYKVRFDDNRTVSKDTLVYLSYAGSTAIKNTSFVTPSKVTIKAGESYAVFEIQVIAHETSYQKFIVVSGITVDTENCNAYSIQILSRKSTPSEFDPVCNGKDCCAYYDKTHELWRDYYPTCMGNIGAPMYPNVTLKNGEQSPYDWYQDDSI